MKLRQIILLVGSAMVLAACGGGGGGGDAAPPVPQAAATFAIAGTLDGAAIAGLAALAPGQTASVAMKSGQDLKLTSDKAVNWSSANNGAVLSVKSINSTVWDNVINAPAGTTTLTLVASAVADTSKVATVTVVVAAQEFIRTATKLGDVRAYANSATLLNGTTSTYTTTSTVATVAADGSYTRNSVASNSTVTSTQSRSVEGYSLSSTSSATGAVNCTNTPAYKLYQFPLFVGKTYGSDTFYSCGAAAYSANRNISATVASYESVTVPAGTFNALKVIVTLKGTSATDIPGGLYGFTSTCFVDAASGVELKCDVVWNYPSLTGVPTTYLTKDSSVLTFKN